MKVLQVIDCLPSTSGGARFVSNLTRKLAVKGVEVEVLLIDGQGSHFLDELIESNIKVHILGNNVNRFHPNFIKQAAKYLDKYDLLGKSQHSLCKDISGFTNLLQVSEGVKNT